MSSGSCWSLICPARTGNIAHFYLQAQSSTKNKFFSKSLNHKLTHTNVYVLNRSNFKLREKASKHEKTYYNFNFVVRFASAGEVEYINSGRFRVHSPKRIGVQ